MLQEGLDAFRFLNSQCPRYCTVITSRALTTPLFHFCFEYIYTVLGYYGIIHKVEQMPTLSFRGFQVSISRPESLLFGSFDSGSRYTQLFTVSISVLGIHHFFLHFRFRYSGDMYHFSRKLRCRSIISQYGICSEPKLHYLSLLQLTLDLT